MAKRIQANRRKAAKAVVGKAKAGRSAFVMKPEYLAEIKRMRLMDDDFMSKCLENAPECIELMLQIILGKKDLKVIKSQEGRRYMCEAIERIAERREARGKRETMLATAKRIWLGGLAVPREVVDTMTNYTDDTAVIYRWRDEMADLIEEEK